MAIKIRDELHRWLICESANQDQIGFFSYSAIGNDKIWKRFGFPEQAITVEDFNCLLPGDILRGHFELLLSYFHNESVLLRIPTALRDAYWAALKSSFRLLGESPLIIGTLAWLLADRDEQFDLIQAKLRRARVIAKES